LRHIERARVLVLLLDLAPVDGRPPAEQERILLRELEQYRPDLLARPRLVVGSKADVATATLDDPDAITISAVTRQGLDVFLGRLGTLVDAARASEPEPEPFVVLRPAEEGFAVVRDGDGAWRVSGRSAERVVAMADLTNEEAVEYVQLRLRRMGVERALARAGAREGDVVRVGPVELEYQEGIS
jgi:GTP-binding protein